MNVERLDRMALDYVARFATTSGKFERYLLRKIDEARRNGTIEPDMAAQLADHARAIVTRFVTLGYIDDRTWAVATASAMTRSGYGERRVRDKLRMAAVTPEVIEQTLAVTYNNDEENADPAEAAALRFARRHKIGPYGEEEKNPENFRRNVAKMVRSGHPYEIACKIAFMKPSDLDI